MAYEGIDKKIYESGIHFRPLQEYAMEEYKWPTESTGGITNAGVSQPYKGYPSYDAWLAAQRGGGGGGGGGLGGPDSYERMWTKKPVEATWQGDYDVKGKKINEGDTGFWGSIKDRFFQPKYQGELGTRGKASYEAGQKLPFFFKQLAAAQSAFNQDSANYNPNMEEQLNYYEGATGGKWTGSGDDLTWTEGDFMVGRDPQSGLLKYGPDSVLSGQNVWSGWGSNNYATQLAKKRAWFELEKKPIKALVKKNINKQKTK